jgi:hypothetical protein
MYRVNLQNSLKTSLYNKRYWYVKVTSVGKDRVCNNDRNTGTFGLLHDDSSRHLLPPGVFGATWEEGMMHGVRKTTECKLHVCFQIRVPYVCMMVEIYGDCVLNCDEKMSRSMRGGRVTHDENKLLCLQGFRLPSLCI